MNRLAIKNNFVQALLAIYGEGEARSIARIVMEDVFPITKSFDFSQVDQVQLNDIQARLLTGEPVQYVLEQADFYGLKLKVSPAVLIPRQETEELVALVVENCGKGFRGSILDIGTGSGCIPIALKKQLPNAQISACDVSEEALKIAELNAKNYQLDINFFICDILDQERRKQLHTYDIIISNPPYIPRKESNLMPNRVKDHEPELALFVENGDALLFYRHITDFASDHLFSNGQLFFELNEYNASEVAQLVSEKGFSNVQIHKDLNGKERMLGGEKSRFF
ncbi:MAG: peptide chain release factor N(5)-glutamine methyltransferase [Bacteroidota bacterium]